MKLLLFDIDGTLLHTGGAGRRSMIKAFEEVYGIKNGFHNVPMSGRTDPVILKDALKLQGLVWKDQEIRHFRNRYFELLEEEIKILTKEQKLMPGISNLLEELSRYSVLVLGLLTGNWRQGAEIKLAHFGLDHYFQVGAFADDSEIRQQLLPFAVVRFQEKFGIRLPWSDIYVIGDTPMDIQCAKPHGARTIAVATGRFSYPELASEKPDYLFHSFEDCKAFLKIFEIEDKIVL